MSAGAELAAAVAAVRPRLAGFTPDIALVLGSGLGGIAGETTDAVTIGFEDVPGLGEARIAGHPGRVVAGTLCGARVIAFAGRRHLYEGVTPARAVLPVRLAAELGASRLLVTNSAGGIRRTFVPGTPMLIRDHINLTFRSPLEGTVLPGEERFPDMSAPYDEPSNEIMRGVARSLGLRLEEGVYVSVLGPSYETPAEIRMLERLGGDAVGMSTVPEVIAAVARGMLVCGLSLITNRAAGSGIPLSHREVLDMAERVRDQMSALLKGWLGRISGKA